MGRAKRNFWQCDPRVFMDGCEDLSLEEIGVYTMLLNMMYREWEPLRWHSEAAQRQVLRFFPAAPQKVRAVINRLIASGRVLCVQIDGRDCLIDERFAEECESYTGQPNPLKPAPAPPKNAPEMDAESGHSSGKGESKVNHSPKSEGDYGLNSPIKSKAVAPIREKEEEKEKNTKKKNRDASRRAANRNRKTPSRPPPDLPERWIGNPSIREAVVQHHGEGFAVSYLDTGRPLKGGVKARTQTAYLKLSQSMAMQGVRVVPPD